MKVGGADGHESTLSKARGIALALVGKRSASRQALGLRTIVLGGGWTLEAARNPEERPAHKREQVLNHMSQDARDLHKNTFSSDIKNTQQAPAEPSVMTSLQPDAAVPLDQCTSFPRKHSAESCTFSPVLHVIYISVMRQCLPDACFGCAIHQFHFVLHCGLYRALQSLTIIFTWSCAFPVFCTDLPEGSALTTEEVFKHVPVACDISSLVPAQSAMFA